MIGITSSWTSRAPDIVSIIVSEFGFPIALVFRSAGVRSPAALRTAETGCGPAAALVRKAAALLEATGAQSNRRSPAGREREIKHHEPIVKACVMMTALAAPSAMGAANSA